MKHHHHPKKRMILIPADTIPFRDIPQPEVTYLEGDEAEEAWARANPEHDDAFALTQPADLT
jgi:hypothetical protein